MPYARVVATNSHIEDTGLAHRQLRNIFAFVGSGFSLMSLDRTSSRFIGTIFVSIGRVIGLLPLWLSKLTRFPCVNVGYALLMWRKKK